MDLVNILVAVMGVYVLHWLVAKVFKKKPNFGGKFVLITGASSGIGE